MLFPFALLFCFFMRRPWHPAGIESLQDAFLFAQKGGDSMKKSFIEALYYGNINLDNLGFRPGGPVHQRVEKANRAEDALRETMTDRQKALFRVYYDA